jgi:Cu/Ag efflux pump CusA
VKTTAEVIREACHEVQRPVFYAIAIIITAYMPIFTLQRVEGRLFRPMAWTVALGPSRRHDVFDSHRAGAGRHVFP